MAQFEIHLSHNLEKQDILEKLENLINKIVEGFNLNTESFKELHLVKKETSESSLDFRFKFISFFIDINIKTDINIFEMKARSMFIGKDFMNKIQEPIFKELTFF